MRALIVDDEAPARAKLRRFLSLEPDVEIVGDASTGREAIAAAIRSPVDVVFLDIQMPGLDGFATLDAIAGAAGPHIVFVTADDGQALRAYEAGADDYLLKPYTADRFRQVLERARARLAERRAAGSPDRAHLSRLLVQSEGRATFVDVATIDRIEAERNYVVLHVGEARRRLRATLSNVRRRMDPRRFVQLNRSTIVRVDTVATMSQSSHGDYDVTLRDGTTLVLTRRYRDRALAAFRVGR